MAINRETAKICRISDLLEGIYITQEGWQPNYVKTAIGNISRANIMGTVVSVEDTKNFLFDDGTGKILVRSFEKEHAVLPGQHLFIIGRPRNYNNDLFLSPEILKPITDPLWIDVRKEQLRTFPSKTIKQKSPATSDIFTFFFLPFLKLKITKIRRIIDSIQ